MKTKTLWPAPRHHDDCRQPSSSTELPSAADELPPPTKLLRPVVGLEIGAAVIALSGAAAGLMVAMTRRAGGGANVAMPITYSCRSFDAYLSHGRLCWRPARRSAVVVF